MWCISPRPGPSSASGWVDANLDTHGKEGVEQAAAPQQCPVLQPFFTLSLSQSHHDWIMMVPSPSSRARAG